MTIWSKFRIVLGISRQMVSSRLLDTACLVHYANVFCANPLSSRFFSLISSLLALRFYYLRSIRRKRVYMKPFCFTLLLSVTEAFFIGNAIWAYAKRQFLEKSSEEHDASLLSKSFTPRTLYRSRKNNSAREECSDDSDGPMPNDAQIKYEKIVCDVKRSERPSPVQKKTCKYLAETAEITKEQQEEILLRHGGLVV